MATKTWVVGEEVLAADFNTYVQKQVVATFPNAAARDAALPAPTVGMLVHLADTTELLVATTTATSGWKPIARTALHTGTWDPVTALGSSPNIAKTIAEARYVLEGNLCSFWFDMTFTGASAGMSALTIALPFPAVGHANFAVIGNGIYVVPTPAFWVAGLALGGAGAGQSVIRYQTEDGLYGVDQVRGVVVNDTVRGTGRYRVA